MSSSGTRLFVGPPGEFGPDPQKHLVERAWQEHERRGETVELQWLIELNQNSLEPKLMVAKLGIDAGGDSLSKLRAVLHSDRPVFVKVSLDDGKSCRYFAAKLTRLEEVLEGKGQGRWPVIKAHLIIESAIVEA